MGAANSKIDIKISHISDFKRIDTTEKLKRDVNGESGKSRKKLGSSMFKISHTTCMTHIQAFVHQSFISVEASIENDH